MYNVGKKENVTSGRQFLFFVYMFQRNQHWKYTKKKRKTFFFWMKYSKLLEFLKTHEIINFPKLMKNDY